MDRQPDDEPPPGAGSSGGAGSSSGGEPPERGGRSDGDGPPDGPRPGLVGVLWCLVVIVAVLVVGVAIGMLDGG